MYKDEFPFLTKNRNYLYFDSAATTLKHKNVLKKINMYYESLNSNIHRSNNKLAEEATIEFENTRLLVSELINCRKNEIVFTSNATNSINFLSNSNFFNSEAEILVTETEHYSNLLPWSRFNLKIVKVDDYGLIDLEDLKKKITKETVMFCFTGVSNVTGNIQNLSEIIDICKGNGIYTFADLTQYISHKKINLKKLDLDFVVFSGHKLFGPSGVGIFYGKLEHLKKIEPYVLGGGIVNSITENFDIDFKPIPYCFEAGTPSIENVIAFGEAIKFLKYKVYPNTSYLKELDVSIRKMLSKRPYIKSCFLLHNERIPLYSLEFNSEKYEEKLLLISELLSNNYNIFINVGYQCAQYFYKSKNKKQTLRLSLHIYNDKKEIEKFFDALDEISIFL